MSNNAAKRGRNPQYGKIKQDPDEYFRSPKRHIFGVSGYLLFSSQKREETKPNKITVTELGHMWSNLPEKKKAKFNEKADKLRNKIYAAEENLKPEDFGDDKKTIEADDRNFLSSKNKTKPQNQLEKLNVENENENEEDLENIEKQNQINKLLEQRKRAKAKGSAGRRNPPKLDYSHEFDLEEENNDQDDNERFDRKKAANSKEAKAQLKDDEKLNFNPLDISTGAFIDKQEQKDKQDERNDSKAGGSQKEAEKRRQEERSGVKPKKDQNEKKRNHQKEENENEESEKNQNDSNVKNEEFKEQNKQEKEDQGQEGEEEVHRKNQGKRTSRKPESKSSVRFRKDGKVDRRTFGGGNVGNSDIDSSEIKDDNDRVIKESKKTEVKEEMKQIESKGENFQ